MLNSTKCVCKRELKGVKFDKYTPRRSDDRFYGGRVAMEGEIKCECGRKLKGYFEVSRRMDAKEQYELIDLEILEDITNTTIEEKIDLNKSSQEDSEPKEVILQLTEEEPAYGEEKLDYDKMSYADLKAEAKNKGIKGNLKREALIEELKKRA